MLDKSEIDRLAEEIRNRSDGVSFLSEVILDECDLNLILGNIDQLLTSCLASDSHCILSASILVWIGCRFYEEKTFWPHVIAERNRTAVFQNVSRIEQFERNQYVRSFNRGLDLLGLQHGPETYRDVDRILIHCFVPDNKLDDFFDFIHSFYRKFMNFSIENMDDDLKVMAEFMKAFKEKNWTKDFSDSDLPQPQKLLVCTRNALQCPEMFAPMFRTLIDAIDATYTNRSFDLPLDNRFTESFRSWLDKRLTTADRRNYTKDRQKRPYLILHRHDRIDLKVPSRRCNPDDMLYAMIDGSRVDLNQPRSYKMSNLKMTLDHQIPLDEIRSGLSPFDSFSIYMGSREIYSSNTRRKYILFNDDKQEIRQLSEGYVTILMKTSMEVEPEDLISDRGVETITIRVLVGDVVHIGDDTLMVRDSDQLDNSMSLLTIPSCSAEVNSELLDVVSLDKVSASITLTDRTSRAIVRMAGSDGKVRLILVDERFRNYYRDDNQVSFDLNLGDYLDESDMIRLDLTENNNRTVFSSRFLYIPDFSFEFNKKFYIDTDIGTIRFGDGSSIKFDANDEYLSFPFVSGKTTTQVRIEIPSIRYSFDGETWYGPGIRNFQLHGLYWDTIQVKSSKSFRVRLYTDVPKIKMEPDERDDQTIFSIRDLKDALENTPYNGKSLYNIYASINGIQKIPFLRITAHNEYQLDKNNLTVYFKRTSGVDAICRFIKNNSIIFERQLDEGLNKFDQRDLKGVRLIILEYNPYEKKYITKICEETLGGDAYIVVSGDGEGFDFHYKNNRITFEFDVNDQGAILKHYDSVQRFNPWMKDRAVRETLRRLISQQK